VTLKGALPLGTLRKCASNVRVKAKFVLEWTSFNLYY
jgi:hypothetical protein